MEMEQWNPEKIYDRMGVDTQFVSLLGVKVPSLTIPVLFGNMCYFALNWINGGHPCD